MGSRHLRREQNFKPDKTARSEGAGEAKARHWLRPPRNQEAATWFLSLTKERIV
jgi:hypothetical protein